MTGSAAALPSLERKLARVDHVLAIVIALLAALLLVMWWTGRSSDRHGMAFVLIGAAWIGPSGPLFGLAAYAMRRRWRWRWLLQAVPVLYPFCFIWLLDRWPLGS